MGIGTFWRWKSALRKSSFGVFGRCESVFISRANATRISYIGLTQRFFYARKHLSRIGLYGVWFCTGTQGRPNFDQSTTRVG